MTTNYSEAQLQGAYEKAFKAYIERDYVTGVDVGYQYTEGKRTDNIVVRVHVKEKLPELALEAVDLFPKEIDGIPLDVIQGIYHPHIALVESASDRKIRLNPIQPGVSISHPRVTAGTFGAVVYDNVTGRPCILSNWHVLAGSDQAVPGDDIIQPGSVDGGRSPRDRVGQLERSILNADGDAAIAFLDTLTDRTVEFAQFQTGVKIESARMTQMSDVGKILEKSGRTTGVTRGKIDGVGSYYLNYPVGPKTVQGFKIVSILDGNPNDEEISSGGDSGAIWYDPATKEGIGLHFAGETNTNPREEYAIACHLPKVLSTLNISLTPSAPGGGGYGTEDLETVTTASPNLNKIIAEMKQLIDILNLTASLPVGTPIDLPIFRQAENKLKNIEFRLQFELLRAEDQNDWPLADLLYDAIEQCQLTLNAVRGALIRFVVIGNDHAQIIAQFRSIRQDIDRAIRVQQVFDFLIRLTVLVRRFVGV
jgi:hypothetical protein